ncbi:hypothetical protein [Coprococcus eutactus]|uniref:hypothetical protein n=1 Tax=Coprococcus eutactus TaxID=33043 RepID=UPI00321A80DE
MNELLQRIANYFAYQYKGNDKDTPKMDMSVDDLRNIAALNIEKCRLETKLRNLQQVKTNADRIRNMSDEELMDTLFSSCLKYMHIDECPYADMNVGMCKKCLSEWLQSEAE